MKWHVLELALSFVNWTRTMILSVVAMAMSAAFVHCSSSWVAVALLVAVIVTALLVPCSVITPATVMVLTVN
jgi:hypothetical protein